MLLKKLERFQGTISPILENEIDIVMIDGGLLLHSVLSCMGRMSSYAAIARNLLGHICRRYPQKEIHIFYSYSKGTLKANERQHRGDDDELFVITGPEQVPKKPCDSMVKNSSFKCEFCHFLYKEWQKSI